MLTEGYRDFFKGEKQQHTMKSSLGGGGEVRVGDDSIFNSKDGGGVYGTREVRRIST